MRPPVGAGIGGRGIRRWLTGLLQTGSAGPQIRSTEHAPPVPLDKATRPTGVLVRGTDLLEVDHIWVVLDGRGPHAGRAVLPMSQAQRMSDLVTGHRLEVPPRSSLIDQHHGARDVVTFVRAAGGTSEPSSVGETHLDLAVGPTAAGSRPGSQPELQLRCRLVPEPHCSVERSTGGPGPRFVTNGHRRPVPVDRAGRVGVSG